MTWWAVSGRPYLRAVPVAGARGGAAEAAPAAAAAAVLVCM